MKCPFSTVRNLIPVRRLRSVGTVVFLASAMCLVSCVVRQDASTESVSLDAGMILNRSVFLKWSEASEDGFGCYEVYAGPAEDGVAGSPVAVLEEADHCYLDLRGLQPETEYVFRVCRRPAGVGDGVWSDSVRATTLRDGTPEGTPPETVRVPTIMYHHVRPLETFPPGYDSGGWYSTENFERDLAWMKANGFHSVTSADILEGRLPENPVFLTFDDGYTDFLEYAVPLLVKYGFRAANAIVTQRTAGLSVWAIPEWPLDSMMTWPQIRKCLQAGMEIGGHTQTHVNLYKDQDQMGQVRGSFNDLVDALGAPPLYFCYPWGMGGHDFVDAKDAAREAGYRLATATWPPRDAVLASDPFFFPRQFANQTDTLENFRNKVGFPEPRGETGKEPEENGGREG